MMDTPKSSTTTPLQRRGKRMGELLENVSPRPDIHIQHVRALSRDAIRLTGAIDCRPDPWLSLRLLVDELGSVQTALLEIDRCKTSEFPPFLLIKNGKISESNNDTPIPRDCPDETFIPRALFKAVLQKAT